MVFANAYILQETSLADHFGILKIITLHSFYVLTIDNSVLKIGYWEFRIFKQKVKEKEIFWGVEEYVWIRIVAKS